MSAMSTTAAPTRPSDRTLRVILAILIAIVMAVVGYAWVGSARNAGSDGFDDVPKADTSGQYSVLEKELKYARDCYDVQAVGDYALSHGLLDADLSGKIFDARLQHHCF